MATSRIEDSTYKGDSIYENPDANESNYYGAGNRNRGRAIPQAVKSMHEYAKPDPPDTEGNQIELATINSQTAVPLLNLASSADHAQRLATIEKKIDNLTQRTSRTTKHLKCLGAGLLILWLICLSLMALVTLYQFGFVKQPGTYVTTHQIMHSLA